jgi:hypothetical protein
MGVSAGNPIRTDEFSAQRPFPHRLLPIRVREDEVAAVPRARRSSFFPMRCSRVSIWSNRNQKDRRCEVAHTSPRPRQITYSVTPSWGSDASALQREHAKRRFMQNKRAEGRSRPACARHPPRARADRTTACAARWTDDCGSGETFSALAYTAKGCCITPNIVPGDFLSLRACGPVECGGLQRAKNSPPFAREALENRPE